MRPVSLAEPFQKNYRYHTGGKESAVANTSDGGRRRRGQCWGGGRGTWLSSGSSGRGLSVAGMVEIDEVCMVVCEVRVRER